MDNKTVIAGTVGALAGVTAGYLLGKRVGGKDKELRVLSEELFGIFGGIVGGVIASALVTPATPNGQAPVATNTQPLPSPSSVTGG